VGSNDGFALNLLYWADPTKNGLANSTYNLDLFNIRRSVYYNQWCHKKWYRGYQYRAG
jgi:hypothetical protein